LSLTPLLQIALLLLSSFVGRAVSYQSNTRRSEIVVIAHEDDWQLFMGDVLANRVRSGSHVVFVYLTAGDVARDSTYWRARERAALASASELAPSQTQLPVCDTVAVNGHRITHCALPNSTAWFLRLPDGGRNGSGYRSHAFQTLRKLRSNRITAIDAIDHSSTYRGWTDLVLTVRAIAALDSGTSPSWHANDPSVLVNPHDHFDHRMAGHLVQELTRSAHSAAFYYLGYALAARDDNLTPAATHAKTRLFQAYDGVMTAANRKWSPFVEHRTFYSECLRRTYLRRLPYVISAASE
jgi:LmbE family N-acetylglucosaminyl deacetylase